MLLHQKGHVPNRHRVFTNIVLCMRLNQLKEVRISACDTPSTKTDTLAKKLILAGRLSSLSLAITILELFDRLVKLANIFLPL